MKWDGYVLSSPLREQEKGTMDQFLQDLQKLYNLAYAGSSDQQSRTLLVNRLYSKKGKRREEEARRQRPQEPPLSTTTSTMAALRIESNDNKTQLEQLGFDQRLQELERKFNQESRMNLNTVAAEPPWPE